MEKKPEIESVPWWHNYKMDGKIHMDIANRARKTKDIYYANNNTNFQKNLESQQKSQEENQSSRN